MFYLIKLILACLLWIHVLIITLIIWDGEWLQDMTDTIESMYKK